MSKVGRSEPTRAARILLATISREPEAALRAAGSGRAPA